MGIGVCLKIGDDDDIGDGALVSHSYILNIEQDFIH